MCVREGLPQMSPYCFKNLTEAAHDNRTVVERGIIPVSRDDIMSTVNQTSAGQAV